MHKFIKEKQSCFQLLFLFVCIQSFSTILLPMNDQLSVKSADFSRLMKAASCNQLEIIEAELKKPKLSVHETSYGTDPLIWAAMYDNVRMIQLLLDSGFQLSIGVNGQTALHSAAYFKTENVLRKLLTHPYSMPTQDEIDTEKDLFISQVRQTVRKRMKRSLQLEQRSSCVDSKVPVRIMLEQLYYEDADKLLSWLIAKHFRYLNPFLKQTAEIIGRRVTPYDAASDIGADQTDACKGLLEPASIELRMKDEIGENYRKKLKAILDLP